MGSPVPPGEQPGSGIASAGSPSATGATQPAPADPVPSASAGPVAGPDSAVPDSAVPDSAASAADPASPAAPALPPAGPPPGGPPPPAGSAPRHRGRTILIWTASITAGVVAIAAVGLFLLYRHLNGNIQQRDVSGLLGSQPVDLHPQAENIAARHALDRLHAAALHQHGTAFQLIAKLLFRGAGYSSTFGGDQVIGDDVAQEIEPEKRHLRQDAALAGDTLRQDAVERRDAVGGDDEQVVTDAVNVTHFASRDEFDTSHFGWGRLSTCGRLAIGPLAVVRILPPIPTS